METVFLGGGTPTQLHPEELRQLFDLIAYWFPMVTDGEYTIEANPEDIDEESGTLSGVRSQSSQPWWAVV